MFCFTCSALNISHSYCVCIKLVAPRVFSKRVNENLSYKLQVVSFIILFGAEIMTTNLQYKNVLRQSGTAVLLEVQVARLAQAQVLVAR